MYYTEDYRVSFIFSEVFRERCIIVAEDIRVEDVFDMDFLQKFQDNFARAVGMTAVTVDADGKPYEKQGVIDRLVA